MKRFFFGLVTVCGLVIGPLASPPVSAADSEFFKKFKQNYDLLSTDLLNAPAEKFTVSNFVYTKDRAVFTFSSGEIYLMRFIDGRPTTAFFFGEGKAAIDIPAPLERQSLKALTGKENVEESFKFCFVRCADDFDLAVRAHASGVQLNLDYREYSLIKQEQGEVFFPPTRMHEQDSYFQLLRSHSERNAGGYFWIDFNRYVVTYDPAMPEELRIAYQEAGVVINVTDGALVQAKSHEKRANNTLSNIPYPTTMLARTGTLSLSGLEAMSISQADITCQVRIDTDSARFVSLYLDGPLNLDSMTVNGQRGEFVRRSEQVFVGLILPTYARKGDTLAIRMFYRSREKYYPAYPFVERPSAMPHQIQFSYPSGFSLVVAGAGASEKGSGGKQLITATPTELLRSLDFQAFAGIDSTVVTAGNGMAVTFLKAKGQVKEGGELFIPDKAYQPAVVGAFDFLATRLGPPPASFDLAVFHKHAASFPGFVGVPQMHQLINETGGMPLLAGVPIAQQWFGSLMQPASERESWLFDAVPDYLALMYVQDTLGAPIFFGELDRRKNLLLTEMGVGKDVPLAAGTRASSNLRATRGSWLLHMLRFAMYDLDTRSDKTFIRFLRELIPATSTGIFTNENIIALAEKQYGQSLAPFFEQYLYRVGIPTTSGSYSINQINGQYQVDFTVTVSDVDSSFVFPVVVRVEDASGSSLYSRQTIRAGDNTFSIGPIATQPKDVVFNELFGMLSRDNVKKR